MPNFVCSVSYLSYSDLVSTPTTSKVEFILLEFKSLSFFILFKLLHAVRVTGKR